MTTIAPEIDTIVDDTTMMVPEMVDTKETTEKEEIVPPTTVQPSVKETTSEPSMVSDGSDTITTIQPLVEETPIDTTIAPEIELEDKLFGETDLETNLFETSTLSSTSTTSSSTVSFTNSPLLMRFPITWFALEPVRFKDLQKSHNQETGLRNRRPPKALNNTKLILND